MINKDHEEDVINNRGLSDKNRINTSSIEDNHQAYDANSAREKHCVDWLKAKKKSTGRLRYLLALIGILNGILVIIQSALLAYLFHQLVIEKQLWTEEFNIFIILICIFVCRSLCHYSFQTVGFEVAATIKRSVRTALFNQFSELGPAYTKQQQSAELATTTLENVEALEGYYARYLPQQTIATVLPIIMIAVVMPVNWVVAIIFCVTGPLIPVFMALVGMGAASANRSQFLAMARMSAYFLDRIQGLTTLKLFGQAETELQNIRSVSSAFSEKTMEVLRIAFLSSAVLEFFSAVAVALVAVYVGLGLLGLIRFGPANEISLQEALFVLLLAPEFFNPLKQLAAHYHDKAAAIGAADHILKVLEQSQPIGEEKNGHKSSDFCIELQNSAKFYQQKKIFEDLNIEIKAGEKIALIGESGVGKSTLFNVLLGFEQVTAGKVYIKGELACRQQAIRNITWAGQQSTIFYATIKDNITLFNSKLSDEDVDKAAKAAGVTDFSQYLDEGLSTMVGEQGFGLSGGQVQRIALARAFVNDKPIVLLDEPTAHLDKATKIQLLDVIDHVFKDKTLIIASHDSDVIHRMERVINLS